VSTFEYGLLADSLRGLARQVHEEYEHAVRRGANSAVLSTLSALEGQVEGAAKIVADVYASQVS
jgi:hypothetical protein